MSTTTQDVCCSPSANGGASCTEAERVAAVEEVLALYANDAGYGVEKLVTEMEHACQAAKIARDGGGDDETVVAALLHDIGWKLALSSSVDPDDVAPDGKNISKESIASKLGILSVCGVGDASLEQQRAQHDVIGGTFLQMLGFSEKVTSLIEGHVLAKRYYCFRDPAYTANLSEGSQNSLAFQGGPMSSAEAALFEKDMFFKECVQLRMRDDSAKVPGRDVPPMSSYRDAMLRVVRNSPRRADQAVPHFKRRGNTLVGVTERVACSG